MRPTKILMIVTSHATLGDTGKATGLWLEELATPYYELLASGASVDIASPAGGRAPIDPSSAREPSPSAQRFSKDATAVAKAGATLRLADVADDYDAYFVAGGHGAMWDLSFDPHVARLLSSAADRGKPVAAVCHGVAALVGVKRADGRPLVHGHRVTSFTDEEERAVALHAVVPYLLESRLREQGAEYANAAPWNSFAVRDGSLVTGQNPQSSLAVVQELVKALEAR